MIIYRFAHKKFAGDLSGTGAKLNGGRWNFTGIPVVYSSEHISLGLLEILANANTLDDLQNIQLLEKFAYRPRRMHESSLLEKLA